MEKLLSPNLCLPKARRHCPDGQRPLQAANLAPRRDQFRGEHLRQITAMVASLAPQRDHAMNRL
ncbi:hypothetical protein K9U39_03935 [Rhodoblastus acidophilus]|nr:hypothetical protein [Rhodoblastus acidophilus]